MKTFNTCTITTALICNLSRKYRQLICLMHPMLQTGVGYITSNEQQARCAKGWSDVLGRK
jgi:hypothetical protein